MHKFIKKVVLFLLLFILMWIIIISADFFIVGNQYLHNYQASIIDKIERIQSIEGNKIILVGNSNVSFGFDSELLERETGFPVANMGIHSGLSNMFQEDMVKPYIDEGDIVLLCHNSFSDGYTISDPSLAWITIEKHKDLWQIIRKDNMKEMIQAYPIYAFNCLVRKITGKGVQIENSCYSREAFNEYGDVVYKPEEEKRPASMIFYKGAINVPIITDSTVDRINEFNEYVTSRGATLLVVGYPVADGDITPEKDKYVNFQEELTEKLNCRVISDYTDYFFPYDFFYNTILHLTEEGVYYRTMQTAKDVNTFLKTE